MDLECLSVRVGGGVKGRSVLSPTEVRGAQPPGNPFWVCKLLFSAASEASPGPLSSRELRVNAPGPISLFSQRPCGVGGLASVAAHVGFPGLLGGV